MANDHVIDVKVRADTTNLSKGLSDAEKHLGKAKDGFSKYGSEAEKASKQTQGFVEKNRGHMETVGKDAMIMGAGILAGVAVAVHAYSEFSSRMAQVQSLSHASAAEMDVLTKSALTVGTAFGLSANDVADAEIELVKAGVSVKEMMGGALPGALALAAAGQIDVGKATEIATIALTQFNLKGKDVPHVADLLAAGADKALGGVQELGDGLKQGGLVASQFGLTIDDTVGTLSAFANAGLIGSDAGTSMKTMFLALASPSKQASDAMAEMGLNAYDTGGKFIGVTALAGQLHDKLGNLSDAQRNAALSTIFGSDAMRAASVLMKEGSTGIQKWIKDVNDQGFAAVQAAGKLDSLNGDFKKLQSGVETGLIQMGAASDGFLRPVVQGLTGAIQAFNDLPEPVKGGILAASGLTGAGLLLGGALLAVIPKISDTVNAIGALRDAAPRTAGALGTIGKAAGIAAAGVVALQAASALFGEKHTLSAEDYGQALLKVGKASAEIDSKGLDSLFTSWDKFAGEGPDIRDLAGAVKEVVNPHIPAGLQDTLDGMFSWTGSAKNDLGQVRDHFKDLSDTMGNVFKSGGAETAAKTFNLLTKEFEKNGKGAKEALDVLPGYQAALKGLGTEFGVVIEGQDLLDLAAGKLPDKLKAAQDSTEGQAKAAEIAAKQTEAQQKALDDLGIALDGTILHLDRLVSAMQASGLISISADQAAISYQKSLEAVDAMVAQNGKTLDIHTKAGKENMEAWLGQASAANNATLANAKNGASSEELQGTLTTQYTQLRDNAIAFGASGDKADEMARKALGIPKNVDINTAIQNYADTMAKAQEIKNALDRIPTHKEIDVLISQRTQHGTDALDAAQNGGDGKAFGGAILDAPGPKGVDSKLYPLAKGEHVLTDKDVDAMGGQEAVYAFRKQLHGGVRPMYAAPAPAAPATMGGFNSAPAVMGDVYVQNPFTGEYLLAQVDHRVGAGLNNVASMVGGRSR